MEMIVGCGIASLFAFAGARNELGARLRAALQLDLPAPNRRVATPRHALWSNGPDAWLLFDELPDPNWPDAVAADLAGIASLFDQSGAYQLLRLSGAQCESLLQSGLFVDLAPARFPVGACLVAPVAHVTVHVARSAPDAFQIAVPRSYAESFRDWLGTAARHAGLALAFCDPSSERS